jgi:hypothetical protein
MRPDILSGLAVFQLVANERSFTRAAIRLGVTQSALSQTVKRRCPECRGGTAIGDAQSRTYRS